MLGKWASFDHKMLLLSNASAIGMETDWVSRSLRIRHSKMDLKVSDMLDRVAGG